ncbi:hypothetical protein HWV62_40006 [Athelia sp. TMB]|nr:hypothetical protein HWV62_40006 [Athelia sp. TMB]
MASPFAKVNNFATVSDQQRLALISAVLKSDQWRVYIPGWVNACTGLIISHSWLEQAARVFVDVTILRASDQQSKALITLGHFQRVILDATLHGEFSHLEDPVDITEDNSDSDSDSGGDSCDDIAEEPIFARTTRNHKEWLEAFLQTPAQRKSRVKLWTSVLRKFYTGSAPCQNLNQTIADEPEVASAVSCLREMRAVPSDIYCATEWIALVKTLGLADIIGEICKPGAFAVHRQNLVEASERLYCWSNSLAEVLHSWTPEHVRETFPINYPPIPESWEPIDSEKFLLYLSDHPHLIPSASRPSTVFLFMSEANFLQAWYTWLMPGLLELGFDADCWNPYNLYSKIMGVLGGTPKTFTLNPKPPAGNTKRILHPRLWLILTQTQMIRANNKLIKKVIPLPPSQSKLKSKVQPRTYTPDELDMQPLSFRPEVYKRCGRDIQILQNSDGEEVGGFQFKHPALELKLKPWLPTVWDTLLQHHTNVSCFKGIDRGANLQATYTGQMVAIGSRQPAGGIPGDTYREYPNLSGDDLDGIETLFSYAYDGDALDLMISGMAPKARKDLHAIFDKHQLNRLGSTGNNMYYCHNYTSPQHRDKDEGISFCIQLNKHCYADEFNFAYAEWGVYLVTEEKCIWWFISDHVHGTVMPRLSSLKLGVRVGQGGQDGDQGPYEPVVCNGIHPSCQKKSAARAMQRRAVHLGYQARTQWWQEVDVEME